MPVRTVLPFVTKQGQITSNQTRSKFYVACTRAKHSIVFVVDDFKGSSHFKSTKIKFGEFEVDAFKYCHE